MSVSLCFNYMLVRTITQDPFKLGSPNLDHRWLWLRSLLFWVIDCWLSRSNLASKSTRTSFWACPRGNSSPGQARTTKFGPEVQNTLVKIPIVLRLIESTCQIYLNFKILFICIAFASLKYLWDIKNGWRRSLHILNGCAQICSPAGSCHGSWNSRVVSLVWPLLAVQSSTRWLAMGFLCFCGISPNYTYLTCRNSVRQHSVMAEITLKQRAFAFVVSDFQHVLRYSASFTSALFLAQWT